MKFSLGPVSWSLANTDGSIYKSVKSKLLQSLEKDIPSLAEVPTNSTLIYDGMCVIQQLPSGLDTFGTISDFVLGRITRNNASDVMFITDQYFETSIKGGERERRASTGQIRITASRCDQPAPKQFKKYLAVGANKTELLEFLVKAWTHPRHAPVLREKTIYFSLKDEAYEISITDNRVSPWLSKYNYSHRNDVAILACYYARILSKPLYIKIGTGRNERILNATQAPFEERLSISLPGLHAFSGCDSMSAFHGIGKVKWLSLVKSHEHYCAAVI